MQPNTIDLTKILKVGDKVYSDKRGWGEVTEIHNNQYPLVITFKNQSQRRHYNKFGFYDYDCITHELYPSSALEPWQEPCEFEKGELVWCNDGSDNEWYLRRFEYAAATGLFVGKEANNKEVFDVWPVMKKFSDCPLPPKIDVK